MKTALAVTGKSKQFTIVCCASLVLFAAGIIVSVLIDNIFLMPVLSVAFALIPFFYTTSTLSYYEKNTKEELETALSIITTSYVRSDDIVAAVRENIKYIKPPLRDVFKSFEGEATAISSNIKRALYKLKSMVDNEIFWEWCDTLIQCQDDRTLKDTLLPIVAKLTDVRIVNSELKTMLSSARNEYWFMVALVVGNIPLLYIRETNNHVAYRVTPVFEGNNLVCSGVQMEAYSVEDSGEGICFNVYCYNVQPGITIDYATGNSSGPASDNTSQAITPAQTESTTQPPAQPGNTETVWVSATGKKYHRKSSCSNMKNPSQISKSDAINRGYEPCKKCY